MRILILGKKGMLGQDLQKVFAKEDFIALDSSELDITNQEAVFETFMTIQPDIVINATGYTAVDQAEEEEEKANQVNGYALGILAKGAREVGATLVHFSTDYVFDGNKIEGYNEDAGTHAINAYGRSKELGEKLMVEEMELEEYPDEPAGNYFLIRTSWLYGKHGKNFVDTMLKLGSNATKDKPLTVVSDQYGCPTYTLDLANQVKFLIESHEYPSGIYHITNSGTTNWYEFARKIFEIKGQKVAVDACRSEDYARGAKRPKYSTLVNTKLPPLRPWDEALKEYLG